MLRKLLTAIGRVSFSIVSRVRLSRFGALGVDGFFVLSGYLIVQSWLGDPEFLNFLRKRVLRIVPGYLVAVVLSTLAVGLLAPGIGSFFSRPRRTFRQQRRSSELAHDTPGFPRASVCAW